ncbi:response regulator [Chitinophagaceae bacterium LB-8]|uniref:histidine kinase n=1 Tax=Paraflavisolibacter caeni TaxID=2982496 RepID=A0A9X3BAG6_9BACT|nr:two-component regulator propeller domain-containing protein [Paraflavisolibacter caeni]MCU7552741.1 response regulator [Paraflavisolibacter caeni]
MKFVCNKYIIVVFVLFLLFSKQLLAFDYPPITYLSIDQGLSNNSVRCIYQDHKGFIWLGTYDGLNRYDGYGFKVFRNSFNKENSLINNWINVINEDDNGVIWIGTRQGLCIYRSLSENFSPIYYFAPDRKLKKITAVIRDIEKDDQGNMFIGTSDMGLFFCAKGDTIASEVHFEYETNTGKSYDVPAIKKGSDKRVWVFVRNKGLCLYDYQSRKIKLINAKVASANCLEADGGNLWMGSDHGIYWYNINSNSYSKVYNEGNRKLSFDNVVSLTLDKDKKLWVATNGGGVNILNTKTDEINYLSAGTGKYSLTSDAVFAIIEDQQDRKWIGTLRGGVNVIDPQKERFQTIVSNSTANNNTISNSVFSFYEAPDGNLWMGTDGGGLRIWNRIQNSFTEFKHIPGNPSSISDNFITDIKGDYLGNIWIATYWGGINRFNKTNHTFRQYKFLNPSDNSAVTALTFLLYEDAQKNLWAGNLQLGLFRLNREMDRFELFDNRLRDLFALKEDNDGVLWAGNLSQLIRIDRDNRKQIFYTIGRPVRSIHEDRMGNFWIGTEGGGLVLFDRKQNKIRARYTTEEGLCNNSVLNILEDLQGNLWLSTFNGLSKFNIKDRAFKNYYHSDGLQSNQFNFNAALSLNTGEFVFGGIKGFSLFRPELISTTGSTPKIFITGIKINNKPLEQDHSYVTKASNDIIEEIKVPYNKAVFTFDFAALEYSSPDKIQYAYYMDGWDRGWNYIGNIRTATYTHLSEGSYIFRVKSTNAEGVWNTKEIRLNIIVLPPWYRSWWAYLFYMAAIGTAIYYYQQYKAKQNRLQYEVEIARLNAQNERTERERSQAELERERAERERGEAELAREQAEWEKERVINEKEKEINEKKLSFFTSISHEFRTPLTLIINPLKDIVTNKAGEHTKPDHELDIVYRNARRMLSLVDQLLLFRKAESEMDKIRPSKLNIYNLANEVYLCFVQQAKAKKIDYLFDCPNEALEVYADREKLEIILYNLLSNALKFTPEGGCITCNVKETLDDVVIEVQDNGAGIPKEVGDQLFDKFYQAERKDAVFKPGFGIGLYLVKQFTEQHKGTISYQSEEGVGTTFTLKLLRGKDHFDPDLILQGSTEEPVFLKELALEEGMAEQNAMHVEQNTGPLEAVVSEKKSILIVDDDEQVRGYLVQLFKSKFQIYLAQSGEEGMELAKKNLPDLIITDIQMQGISGIDLCKTIKEDASLGHIPVILLTGSTSSEIKLQGVEGGADDYITKPFDKDILLARVASLLKARTSLQKYFYGEITLAKSDLKISSEYKEFLDKCMSIVEAHLDDETFNVKSLLAEMGMSHSSLLRKVKSVSGLSINAFIRFIRLRKAAEILIHTNCNTSETAFQVGIYDVKYFREQFNKVFGMKPSEFIKKYRRTFGNQYTLNKDSINPEKS